MTLNRASRKEAEIRLSRLRRQVSLQAFTLRFEDSACREARTAAEELAETTSRLSVEIHDASGAGDLLRKHRVDAVPALVVSAKDVPDLRLYGAPVGEALAALLDALVLAGTPFDPQNPLLSLVRDRSGGTVRAAARLDLVISRRCPQSSEAAACLWRTTVADYAAGDPFRLVSSVRVVEEFPLLAAAAAPSSLLSAAPFLLLNGTRTLEWPFAESDILSALG